MTVIRKNQNEYFVACKRHEPVFPDSPYMTITACIRLEKHQVAFYWGHYDLTCEQVHTAIAEAEANASNPGSDSGACNRKTAKRPMTNIERVTHIMSFSNYGALAQMFVMEALHKWSGIISEASPECVDNGFVNGEAWIGVAHEIRKKLKAEMLVDDAESDEQEPAPEEASS